MLPPGEVVSELAHIDLTRSGGDRLVSKFIDKPQLATPNGDHLRTAEFTLTHHAKPAHTSAGQDDLAVVSKPAHTNPSPKTDAVKTHAQTVSQLTLKATAS